MSDSAQRENGVSQTGSDSVNVTPSSAHTHRLFLAYLAVAAVLAAKTIAALFELALSDDRFTHTIAAPFISFVLVWLQRHHLTPPHPTRPIALLGGMIGGWMLVAIAGSSLEPDPSSSGLRLPVLALVTAWLMGLVLFYGLRSLRAVVFPALLLFVSVPPPEPWLHALELFLQRASADATHLIFKLTPVPVFREGLRFTLPGVVVEVAEECSGLRSSLGLALAAAVAAYLSLRSNVLRISLLLLVIPITIAKNAVRIVGLSLLGAYVSMDFLLGSFHRYSGLPFSILSFGLTGIMLLLLQRGETRMLREKRRPGLAVDGRTRA